MFKMQPSIDVKIATSALQVLVLMFAGLATLLYQLYESDTDNLSHQSPEVVGWLFMSVSITFLLPSFLLTLLILAQMSDGIVDIVLFLLGGLIATPTVFLSCLNIWISATNGGDIDWPWYQRTIHLLSGVIVVTSTLVISYHTFVETLV